MRLLTFALRGQDGTPRLGALCDGAVVDLAALDRDRRREYPDLPLPETMRGLLAAGEAGLDRVRSLLDYAASAGGDEGAQWTFPLSAVMFYPPVRDAEKFLCVGKNYRQHLEELRRNDLLLETPQEPTAFVKYNYCLSGHDWRVVRPEGIVRLDYEPELVFVIGKRALGVGKAEAFRCVAGVTILNDLTCRDLQKREVASGSRFWTGKNIPGFGPLGPCIITMDEIRDPYDLWMTCTVNGEQRMRFNTADQIWKLPDIIDHFSRYIPFEPGDLFATGTPGGTAIGKPNAAELFLKPGDVVECAIEGMMTLRTTIVAPGGKMKSRIVTSGLPPLDQVLQGLRLGDNVVWQVDRLADYVHFAEPFARQAIREGRRTIYFRFAPHAPILPPLDGLATIEVSPHAGFDAFSGNLNHIIEAEGREVFYVFDSLSALVVEWATDELLANFFQVTCPFLFELDTVAYFALTRGRHSHSAVARIRDTTQLLLDVYRVEGNMYLHPLKVWDRYSPQMFLPHVMSDSVWTPVFGSGEAAALSVSASRKPLQVKAKSIAPWESVYRRLMQYHETGLDLDEKTPEVAALKQELSRMIIGTHPEFSRLVDAYMTLDDLFAIRDRLIGSGRIGGKAAGMLLARRILVTDPGETDFTEVLEAHDSFYIGSDVFFTFLVNNDLFRMRLQLSRATTISREEFAEVEKRFLAGSFPPEIMEQFRDMLAYFGQAPIIARSSSLLEDSFGNAFAGKYHSEYCANQGTPEERLEVFLRAVKLVYASALNPDAMTYRRARGLGESDEQMAILVQRVSGTPYRHYFFPTLAGVAFSRNLYAWTDRIDPARGMIRLVFGLGTRAVNRVGNDYPRMIAVSHPQLRPESGARIAKYSQTEVDLIDLERNELATLPLAELLADRDYPNLHLLVSLMKDGYPVDPWTSRLETTTEVLILTVNNLIARTAFVGIIGDMLARLEKAYGQPLDTEFTAAVDAAGRIRINLLQCRPMRLPGAMGSVQLPADIPPERLLFRSSRTISGGVTGPIRYLLNIDPERYCAVGSPEVKKSIGRIVGRINEHPAVAAGRILMMGPGRWGSSNIELGVNVSYADINNTAVLVEMAREEAGQVPEVSYGTHFFLDLVEAQIIYLPVYPNDPEAEFNGAIFECLPNILTDLLPDAERFREIIRVFDLPAATGGRFARVVADPQSQRAVCYLE